MDITDNFVSTKKTANSTVQIYYLNSGEPNTNLEMSITRMDTNEVVYLTDELANLDEFTYYYDYTTASGINDTTQFMLTLNGENSDGTFSIERYFNTFGESGILNPVVAVTISFMILVFGLTFTISRLAFSYFGIISILISFVILSFSLAAWYITFMYVINAIVLVFVVIIMYNQNYSTMVG